MEIVLMIVFLVAFAFGCLKSLTDVPTIGEAIMVVVMMMLCFAGVMVVYLK